MRAASSSSSLAAALHSPGWVGSSLNSVGALHWIKKKGVSAFKRLKHVMYNWFQINRCLSNATCAATPQGGHCVPVHQPHHHRHDHQRQHHDHHRQSSNSSSHATSPGSLSARSPGGLPSPYRMTGGGVPMSPNMELSPSPPPTTKTGGGGGGGGGGGVSDGGNVDDALLYGYSDSDDDSAGLSPPDENHRRHGQY